MPAPCNRLIAGLPGRDRERLLNACEPVHLAFGEVLAEPSTPVRYVYFPTGSYISLLAENAGKPSLEVGLVGAEGMLGAELALGIEVAPLHALVQGAGAAWRIDALTFRKELAAGPALPGVVHRYLYVVMQQLMTAAPCLRFHQIAPRLARWLQMSQDRAHADSFHVTHEFLAYMLGVRRGGITVAAGALQAGGLIEYHRGELTVLDRAGLEQAACSCYAANRKAYTALLP